MSNDARLPRWLFAQIMTAVSAIFLLTALAAVKDLARLAVGNLALGLILYFSFASIFTVLIGSWLIYSGVKGLITRQIPFSPKSQLRGIPAQIGAIVFIICGLIFTTIVGLTIHFLIEGGKN